MVVGDKSEETVELDELFCRTAGVIVSICSGAPSRAADRSPVEAKPYNSFEPAGICPRKSGKPVSAALMTSWGAASVEGGLAALPTLALPAPAPPLTTGRWDVSFESRCDCVVAAELPGPLEAWFARPIPPPDALAAT